MSADAAFSRNFESSSSSAAVCIGSAAKAPDAMAVVNNIAAVDLMPIKSPRYAAPNAAQMAPAHPAAESCINRASHKGRALYEEPCRDGTSWRSSQNVERHPDLRN